MPVYSLARLYTQFLEPVDVEESLYKVHCYGADYDINIPERLNKWTEVEVKYCDRMHGFTVEYFEEKFEPKRHEISLWYTDLKK